MEQNEFQQRFCPVCNEQKNKLVDGVEIITRCTCDWQRGLHERIKKTIPFDFWGKTPKGEKEARSITFADWSPPLFRDGGSRKFKSFIKVQKAFCIQRLYNFCFKRLSEKGSPDPIYALDKSIERGHNLYIRGPAGSGRDLLISQIKFHTAYRKISTTPLPGEWSTFKSEIAQCNWNGKEADEAKQIVADKYRHVQLLTLSNVKGENSKFPFKGATLIDDLLSKRALSQGSMVFTSSDFIHEMGESVGDRLPDILRSDNTSLILLFDPVEADELLNTIIRRLLKLRDSVEKMEFGKKGVQNQLSEEKDLETLNELFLMEEIFKKIPISNSFQDATSKLSNESISELIDLEPAKYHEKIRQKWLQFNAIKKENSLAYQENLKKVYIAIVKDCPGIGNKMTEKEMIETGKMLKYACSGDEEIKSLLEHVRQLREKILTE